MDIGLFNLQTRLPRKSRCITGTTRCLWERKTGSHKARNICLVVFLTASLCDELQLDFDELALSRRPIRERCAWNARRSGGLWLAEVVFFKGAYFFKPSWLEYLASIQATLIWYLRDFSAPFKLWTGAVWEVQTVAMKPGRVGVSDRSHGGGRTCWRWRCRSWNYRRAKLTASMSALAVVCH